MTTDSIGDLDNLMKPIIDSLTGSNGLFVDDSQIKSLYNEWNSINKNIYENIVTIFIDFSNDYCYEKINLKFIEIKNNLYIPYNFNLNFLNKESILTLIMVITSFNFSTKLYQLVSIDMPTSFHRSRLNQILQNNIYNKDKIKNLINTFYNDKNEIKNNLLRLESIQNLNIEPKYIKLINDFLNNYFD